VSDDTQTGIFVAGTPEELAAWQTAAALEGRHLTVERWAHALLTARAASVERRFTGEQPRWFRRWLGEEDE
jgi:hypothetical protein